MTFATQPAPRFRIRAVLFLAFALMASRLSAMEDPRPSGDFEDDPTALRVTAVASKERFKLLEPIVLRIEVENSGRSPAHLPIAWISGRRIFNLTARRIDDDSAEPRSTVMAEVLEQVPALIVGKGPYRRSIAAGERVVDEARVNLYCDMTVPGEYEIDVEVVHFARSPVQPLAKGDAPNPPLVDRAPPVRVVVLPEIAPGNPPAADDRAVTSVVSDGRVEIESILAKTSFDQSEPVPLRVIIKNIGDRPIKIRSGPRPFDLKASWFGRPGEIMKGWPKDRGCPATVAAGGEDSEPRNLDGETVEIAPGGRVVHSLLANLVRDMSRAGDYVIEMNLPYEDATANRENGVPAPRPTVRTNYHRLTVHDPVAQRAARESGLSGHGIGGGGARP